MQAKNRLPAPEKSGDSRSCQPFSFFCNSATTSRRRSPSQSCTMSAYCSYSGQRSLYKSRSVQPGLIVTPRAWRSPSRLGDVLARQAEVDDRADAFEVRHGFRTIDDAAARGDDAVLHVDAGVDAVLDVAEAHRRRAAQ